MGFHKVNTQKNSFLTKITIHEQIETFLYKNIHIWVTKTAVKGTFDSKYCF